MKKWLFIIFSAVTLTSYAQSLDQNFTMSIVPKKAMTIDELANVVEFSNGTIDNLIIDFAASNQTFVASQSITLENNTVLTPDVTLKINDPSTTNESVFRDITYYDGLGRSIQSINIGQSPNGKDLVQHYEYDQFGRIEKSYLPFASTQNTGNLVNNPTLEINTYYQTKYGDTNPFTEQRFDNSPLSRVLESASPGNDWQMSYTNDTDHTTKYDYDINDAKQIRLYDIDNSGNLVLGINFYNPNELMKNISKNENWQPADGKLNTSEVYTDKNGRIIAKINHIGNNGSIEEQITQYVYDYYGRLAYMMPPKANGKMLNNTPYEIFDVAIPFDSFVENPELVQWRGSGYISLQSFHTEAGVTTDYDFGAQINFQFDDTNPGNGAYLKLGNIFTFPNNGTIVPDRHLFDIYNSNDSSWYEFSIKNGSIHNVLRARNGPDNDPQAAFKVAEIDFDFREVIPALFSVNTTTLDELVYQFKYDELGRQIAKKTPGKGWEYIVYDQLDNPILIQDANLREENLWLFTKHDSFGRVVYSGKCFSTKSRENLQLEVDNFINNSTNLTNVEKRISGTNSIDGVNISYSNSAYPKNGITQLLSVNYYDDYNFVDLDKPSLPSNIEGQLVSDKTQGLPTANWTKTLEENSWSKSYTFYDEKGRNIKIYEKNHLGGYTTTDNKLDFRGNTEKTITTHKRVNSSTPLTIHDRYEYDTSERLIASYKKINNQSEELIHRYEYDALGNIENKNVGGLASSNTSLQQVSYTYNIRGWLKEINDVDDIGNKLFAFKLNYNDPIEGTNAEANSHFNGNITQSIWRSKHDNTKKSYAYTYDELNRVTNANYLIGNSLVRESNNAFEVHNINYDTNGNIKYLDRNGPSEIMDQLSYNYGLSNGNQLTSITDNANKTVGFIDGNINEDDYAYDENGNMIKDLNKNISEIAYNHLDLIKKVTFNDGKSINFTYDASGRKLAKTFNTGNNTYKTEYLGGFQYQQNQLQFFPMDEGYVYQDNANLYKYVYTLADHLGNNRVTYSDTNGDGTISSAELLSNTDYYPMGLTQSGEFNSSIASEFKYKYQGKELQEDNNIDLYDFGSRMYDPTVGRWFNTDPQNQFGSPYLAMGNNHVAVIDPNGEYSEAVVVAGIILATVVGAAYAAISTASNGGDIYQSIGAGIKGATVSGFSATVGAATGGAVTSTGIAYAGTLAAGASAAASTTSANLIQGNGVFEGVESNVIGSMVGSYIGGGIGSFTGGAISGGLEEGLNGGDFGEIASSAGISGAQALATYLILEELYYQDYQNGPKAFGDLTRSGYRKFSTAVQRSFARNREVRGYFLQNGEVSDLKWGSSSKVDYNTSDRPTYARASFHTHPNRNQGYTMPSMPADFEEIFAAYIIAFDKTAFFADTIKQVNFTNRYNQEGISFANEYYNSFDQVFQNSIGGTGLKPYVPSFNHSLNRGNYYYNNF
ncbi:DUF6443 domain-containing protein [Aquimarina sp. 2304DJ70-9]|uniref:DUF6443 domain-containing protein n=1 Tax=Aquimarina penaris TaxID=3231044 RepID=UPI0034625E8F